MQAWTTLPKIARDIDVPDSTVRRWASSLEEFLPSRGRGAGRRFDPSAKTVLGRARDLYAEGLSTEQIVEILRGEDPSQPEGAGNAVRNALAGQPRSAPATPIPAPFQVGMRPAASPGTGPQSTGPVSATPAASVPTLPQAPQRAAGEGEIAALLDRVDARLNSMREEMQDLKDLVARSEEVQRLENARFRAVLGALVDLIEVQDQNRRLSMIDLEKREAQNHQRVMIAVQELLGFHRRRG
ncbi:MAG: MerR family transcriptional regulator [Proteobacteria bacterium]|nr:MerR family transcriptional regulator [Pseudomonadota bacterium]